jgi:hypothetical protein
VVFKSFKTSTDLSAFVEGLEFRELTLDLCICDGELTVAVVGIPLAPVAGKAPPRDMLFDCAADGSSGSTGKP